MVFAKLFGRRPHADAAHALYAAIVGQARRPAFYAGLGLPDTVEGRTEAILLHAHLVLRRLKRDGATTEDLAQELFDTLFGDLDSNLRQLGVSDLRIGAKVKKLAQGFYGRIQAYDAGLDGQGDLMDALDRNMYRDAQPTKDQLAAVAAYMGAVDAYLAKLSTEDFLAGRVDFPPAPEIDNENKEASP